MNLWPCIMYNRRGHVIYANALDTFFVNFFFKARRKTYKKILAHVV